MMKTLVLAFAATAAVSALTACADTPQPERAERLAGYCQIQPCNCRPNLGSGIGGGETGVYWTADGRAYCPEGYHLRVVPPPRTRQ